MSSQTNLRSLASQLRKLITERGIALLDDPDQLRSWLNDLAPDCISERNLIVTALAERIPQELRKLQQLDRTTLHQFATRLETNRSIASSRAQWVVLEWAKALNIPHDPSLANNLQSNDAQHASPQYSQNVPLDNINANVAPNAPPAAVFYIAQNSPTFTLPYLSAWNPLSYVRLLIWALWSPQRLEHYRNLYGSKIVIASRLACLLGWAPLFLLYFAVVFRIAFVFQRYNSIALLVIVIVVILHMYFDSFDILAITSIAGVMLLPTAIRSPSNILLAFLITFIATASSLLVDAAIAKNTTGAAEIIARIVAGLTSASIASSVAVYVAGVLVSSVAGSAIGVIVGYIAGFVVGIVAFAIVRFIETITIGVVEFIAATIAVLVAASATSDIAISAIAGVVTGSATYIIKRSKLNLIGRAMFIALLLSYAVLVWLLFFGGFRTLNVIFR